ncbi:hypothetical protein JCM9957A_70320 [Kineosporia succinea]|uniref:Uncharacterized protein n=2 Tax=Kineosporia succinea TaxID=84632 RepID=A0ABT9NVC4_9ACTN|nr:hypothetical protein [Kineosporia succinea]
MPGAPIPALSDEDLTSLMGPKCPECGWRGGEHRKTVGEWVVACSSLADVEPGPAPSAEPAAV